MTSRQLILEKPADVQEALRVLMVSHSVKVDRELSHEELAKICLEQWTEIVASMEGYLSEVETARRIIEGVREQEVWGAILRKGTN